MNHLAIATLAVAVWSGCRGPRAPAAPPAAALTLEVARPASSLTGVAGLDGQLFTAISTRPASAQSGPVATETTTVESWRGEVRGWSTTVVGSAAGLAIGGGLVVAPLVGTGTVGTVPGTTGTAAVRGEPGAALIALDPQTGASRWRIALDTDGWIVVAAIAATADGVVVGGSFSGSLRLRDHVVTSAGRSDGFVARIGARGEVAWVRRIGGAGADAVQGVAARGPMIAIAGTFVAGADLLGAALPAFDPRSPYTDGFVAAFDLDGRRRWSASFGGKQSESVAGVAIDGRGRVAVAGSARDVVHVGGVDLIAQGPGDGMIAWWTPEGSASHAVLVGGSDFDGLRAIAATGEQIVVGGFYSGTVRLGDHVLTAAGGDGAFVAAYDPRGAVIDHWEIAGPGREDVTALAALDGGFIAGITYTAGAKVGARHLAAPAAPMTGAAVIVRPVP